MGNTSENKEEGENQQDEIPRDTQFNNQNVESPSAHENQPSQINQINQQNQSEQQFYSMQGGEQHNIIQNDKQNISQQASPEIQQNQRNLEYQMAQSNQVNQINQEYIENQTNQENVGYASNQEGYEQNKGSYVQYQDGYGQNQEGYEEMEGNQEYIEGEENIEGEGEGEEYIEGEENIEGQEIQENEEIPDDEDQNELVDNQNNQQGNNQINKQSRSYQINKDGKVYHVNEEYQQYQINSGENNYQIKKEFKKTTKTDENIPNYQINRPPQGQDQIIISQENNSIRKNIKVLPQDGLSKVYDGYFENPNIPQGRYTHYYSDIPRYMSFQRSTIKNSPKIRSSLNVVKTENNTELVEIPKSEYQSYMGRETIFIGDGMDTGEYKFRGQGIIITQAEVPEGKIIINEEDILKEINRRKNKPKKEKKIRYEVLDRFYAITEFDGIPIKKIGKVEQQQKQYEYEEQQKYISSSKGNASYKFSSKESQSQQIQSNNQSQQYQFHQSMQQMNSQQMQQMNFQNQNMNSSQMQQMNIRIMQNINNINNNIKYKNLPLSTPSDNYSKYLFEQINKIRADPQSYIGIIEDAKNNIIKDKNGRILYNGKIKIALTNGENSFNNAIHFLKTVKPMGKLEFNPYLTVELPKSESEIKYKNDLRLKVKNMINSGISIKSYWRDVIKDPEISFLMMIVDDNGDKSGMRRKDLLDPNMKYIGINAVEINGSFVCYITLCPKE